MTDLINQPTAAPTRKVRIGAIVGLIVSVALAIVDASGEVALPAWLVGPATLVAAVGSAYLARASLADT